ncbi:helix-turn-helix domain-containing protein [Shewanella dokdonensis]|uniref:Helix-turn-helix transcriptional regulator n=1 Tax=Shewanella dokdonensis TaxID=712036 RepID=A0ABX8DF71_9GAMM|nr:helix-turn-helix transcriptional regulator [Shewanella dokdonensis]MCL1076499.1 helix-turn-helix domain-containing protein [Shewanella dokdonensis]QVK23281.1 helix-turn-helix transcriptional regulator [Shewanella dokdonensis]
MTSFGTRLREERERLGYNQTDFGDIGGVRKNAQSNYEQGERQPDAEYLQKIQAIGVDVHYLLTGERRESDGMIKELLQRWHQLSAVQREIVISLFKELTKDSENAR